VRLAKNIHRVAKDFDFGSGCTLSTTSPVTFRNFSGVGVDGIGPHIGFVLLNEIQVGMSLPGTGGRGAAPVRTAAAVLLPTGSWEKASTGVASFTFAPNQNLQTSGVTNVVSSQAMTAIPLPMER
jgi:hypothetical protein